MRLEEVVVSLSSRAWLPGCLLFFALGCLGQSSRERDEDDDSRGGAGPKPGIGGSAGTGDGGTNARGGSGSGASGNAGGVSGSGGSGPGGTSGAGASGGSGETTGGSSGNATGGAAGSGGSSGTNTCPECTPIACTTLAPPTSTLNDFDDLLRAVDPPNTGIYGVLDASGVPRPEWWTGYFSGAYAYPSAPQECSGEPAPPDVLDYGDETGELRVTGTVGGPSGFGVWFGQCIVDMSAYGGVSFVLGGATGPAPLTFRIFTAENSEPDPCYIDRGGCDPVLAGACRQAEVTLVAPSTPTRMGVRFSELSGGSPSSGVDSAQVLQMAWEFGWNETMTPYDVDVTLDDVVLIE